MDVPCAKVLLVALTVVTVATGCSQDSGDSGVASVQLPRAASDFMQPSREKPPTPTTEGSVVLHVPIIRQKPELRNGCEVTSLAMLLQYAGVPAGKMQLAGRVKKDPDRLRKTGRGITHWGNPNHGFVGDIRGQEKGYAVYHGPLRDLMEIYLPGRTKDLSGSSFGVILRQVRNRRPVIVWTTSDFSKPNVWRQWLHRGELIRGTFEEHAVVLVGYDRDCVYVNDPLTGRQAQRVNRKSFEESWVALGRQALSYQ